MVAASDQADAPTVYRDYTALQACKDYMRVDGCEDDDTIFALMDAAAAYLNNAGIPKPVSDSPLYNLALQSLTLHFYDHRDAVGTEAPLPTGLRPILNQLKLISSIS